MKPVLNAFIAFLLLGTSAAMAACPPEMGGTTAEEIRDNQARIVCLQNEVAAEARMRKLEFDIDAVERRLQDMQLQQRIDSLPKYVPPPVYVPPVMPPML